MMKSLLIVMIILFVLYCPLRWYEYYKLKKETYRHLKTTKYKGNKKDLQNLNAYRLYLAYKELPRSTLKLLRLRLLSMYQEDLTEKFVDIAAKIFFAISLPIISLIFMIPIALLGLLNNDELKKDLLQWIDQVTRIINHFRSFLDDALLLLVIIILLTVIIVIHISVNHYSKKLLHQHLVAIDEVERER